MKTPQQKPRNDRDLATLVCLLQSYEHYGNREAQPLCLNALTPGKAPA